MHYRPVLSIIAGCLLTANVMAADLMQTYMEALANGIPAMAFSTENGEDLRVADAWMLPLVRELLEPKLLGKQTGIYPVVMLLSVYGGIRLFGLWGIVLGPLYAVLLKEGLHYMKEIP